MNELSKVVNAQLQQAAENLVRNRLMSDEFLDFVQENTKPLDTLMAYYKCAIMEVETKFKVLNEQFSLEYDRNPIESIKTRVKSLDGIVRKVRRKNIPLTLSAIEQNINDIAGIRVVCSFPEDIYLLADCLLQQDDIRLIEQKDYIKHPKENGYRSLHLIVAVPIFLQNEKREMKVEVQLRTIAMDFWASLEHKVRYKKNVPADETERLAQELSECAQISADLDQRMQNIRTRLADAELQHPQKQKKDEQILLDVLGLECRWCSQVSMRTVTSLCTVLPWTYFQMDTAAVGDALTRLNVFFRKNIHDRQLRVWDKFSTFLCKIKHCLISMREGWAGYFFILFCSCLI